MNAIDALSQTFTSGNIHGTGNQLSHMPDAQGGPLEKYSYQTIFNPERSLWIKY